MTGTEITTEIRRLLYEATADLWTDADILAHANAEVRLLPVKGIYLEELWTTSFVANQQDYALPSNTVKVERVEVNYGSESNPDYREVKGWDVYADALWFEIAPTTTDTVRVHIKKKFTELSALVESDIPEEKLDIVIYGGAIRCYQQLIGYMVDSKNYDSIIKPDGIQMAQVRAWITELMVIRDDILRVVRGNPRPRSIDLTG